MIDRFNDQGEKSQGWYFFTVSLNAVGDPNQDGYQCGPFGSLPP